MKTNILVASVIASGLALAGAADAQVLGGTVGGAVNGAVGGVAGPGASGSGALGGTAAGAIRGPGVNTPSLPTTPALPRTPAVPPTPSVALPNANASAQGSANANASAGPASANAGLSAGASLDTLATGMAVQDASGKAVGKVRKVVRSAKGTVESVLVTGADGARRTIRLAPDSLSINGQVVTTTQAHGGVNQ